MSEIKSDCLFNQVLLIEDEDAHVFLIKRALKSLVGSIDHAATISEGVSKASSNEYQLIISDLNLPDSSGAEGISQVIQAAGTVPVVVLTSSKLLSDAIEALKFGAKDFLVKEFDHSFQESVSLALSRLYANNLLQQDKLRIEREMEVLRVAIENSTDAMAIVNRQGQLEYSNKTFDTVVKRFKGQPGSFEGLFGDALQKVDSVKKSVFLKLGSLLPGSHWSTELVMADNKEIAYDFSLSVIARTQEIHHESCVIWIRDISETKQREKFQREILSTTSHDLKGPLGAISISAELIQDLTKEEDKAHQLAIRVESSARGALNLIDEFLSARRIEEGTFILKPKQVQVQELLETVKSDYGSLAVPKKIELSLEVDSSLQANVDPMGFVRAVGNLLNNALKFTDAGGQVTLRAKEDNDQILIEVEDNGSGMEPAEVQKVFERFGRLEKHSAIDGSGLGLFVVKSIVKAHGGQIEVTSSPGSGTTFSLKFPFDPPINERGELISLDFS